MNKHVTDRQLLLYLENELAPGPRERVDAHLPTCPMCRARLERLSRTAADLTATLQTVGEQVPLSLARSWDIVARRWQRRRSRLPGLVFSPTLRHVMALVVLACFAVGLVGLIRTLAVTGPTLVESTPTPDPTPTASPSAAPGPLPHPDPNRLAAPVSLLVLGIDGESATSDEADVLVLLYLDAETERISLVFIPRNLYVEVPGHGQARAGSIYGLGQQDDSTSGLTLARKTISDTLGLSVQHTALVRFESFVTLIDAIGGVDVNVPHPIDDPDFPDDQGGFDPLSIPAGAQHFDGATALLYARTRAVPADGFDRVFRQQQLMLAVHDRVARLDMLPDLITQAPTLWSAVADGLETDLSLSYVIDLALLAADLDTDDITVVDLGECCTVPRTIPDDKQVLLIQSEEMQKVIETLVNVEEK